MNSPFDTPASAARVRRRGGMTLVELLVVTGLIAVFLALTVAGIRGSRRGQQRGAETLAAVLSAAQSRALGVPEGAAAILASGSGAGSNAAAACTSLYDAVMLPLIEATVTGSLSPGTTSAAVTVTPTNGDDVQRAYKVLLFGGQDNPGVAPSTAWLAFTPSSSTAGTLAFRTTLGQTAQNTVWPKPPAGGAFNALLAQYPTKSSAVVQIDESSAVDLGFSGLGDTRSTTYGRLDGKGTIAVVFDRVGRVAEIIQQVPEPGATAAAGAAQPAIPVGTLYFLVAPRDLVLSGSNTLSSSEATWVALATQTGRMFVAENVPQSATDDAALQAARAKARQGIGVGK
ncbi:MAG: Tfp pilus assembly protein FimT/FimU [Planctomycetaceae bacterium]